MEAVELHDIVIVGAGIAGLATALGLHRLGIRSLVLESWDELRVTGFGLGAWTNAWKALDALGIGDSLRQTHLQLKGLVASPIGLGSSTAEISFLVKGKHGEHEARCLRRKDLLETLANELPQGTIRLRSKVVSIDEADFIKLVHLADGSVIKTKALIGCDGVNSVVAKSIGLREPNFTGRCAFRGAAEFPNGHAFEPKMMQFFGDGFRAGFIPCDPNTIYWFYTYSPSVQDREEETEPSKMKQFVLQNLAKAPEDIVGIVEQTNLDSIIFSHLRLRQPLDIIWPEAINKDNVCVAGDALHAMTPDLGQGGCASLEDGVILARCLAESFSMEQTEESFNEEEEYNRIKKGMQKFAYKRKWRSFDLIVTSYMVGKILQSNGRVVNFLRDQMSPYMGGMLLKRADFDCGRLTSS